MKRAVVIAVLAALALGAHVNLAGAQSGTPELTQPVNDFAGVISAEDEVALDSLIRRLLAASGDTIVVATIKTFKPAADLRSYATEMFENHGRGIGQKGKDNGLLMVMAVDDRQVWSEVGYDLEGIITDGFAGEISRTTMVPYFRANDYGGGLLAGVTRIARRIAEVRNVTLDGVPVREPAARDDDDGLPLVVWLVIGIVVINGIRATMHNLSGGSRRRRGRRR
jgi:uncharacterized protein